MGLEIWGDPGGQFLGRTKAQAWVWLWEGWAQG